MATNRVDVLDANIIIIPSDAVRKLPNLATVFESSEFGPLLRQPISISQGVSVDPASGIAIQNYSVESIRSQKTVTFSPMRIEIHDRTGSVDLASANLPEIAHAIVDKIEVAIRAVGVNFEASLQLDDGTAASGVISGHVVSPKTNALPSNMRIVGAGVRYFFVDDADPDADYTVAIEPRGIDRSANVIWMTCNAEVPVSELPSAERLQSLLEHCRDVVLHLRDRLTGDSA